MKRLLLLGVLSGCAPAAVLEETEGAAVERGQALTVSSTQRHTVQSIAGNQPGESDLFIDGRPLATAPGPDDMPLLFDGDDHGDKVVVFVSARSGIASLWRVDINGGGLRQLTNRGLVVGKLDVEDPVFVPPPARALERDGRSVVYDDGSGTRWRVDIDSGVAARVKS